jgi:hypothetical protein
MVWGHKKGPKGVILQIAQLFNIYSPYGTNGEIITYWWCTIFTDFAFGENIYMQVGFGK